MKKFRVEYDKEEFTITANVKELFYIVFNAPHLRCVYNLGCIVAGLRES